MSIRLGFIGIFLLFAGGLGVVASPANALLLMVAMVAGIVLLLVAFRFARAFVPDLVETPPDQR